MVLLLCLSPSPPFFFEMGQNALRIVTQPCNWESMTKCRSDGLNPVKWKETTSIQV